MRIANLCILTVLIQANIFAIDFAPLHQRQLPVEEKQEVEENRLQHLQDEQKDGENTLDQKGAIALDQKAGVVLPPDYFMYPGYDHWALYFSNDGRIVELEDESQWFITLSDLPIALNWATGDHLNIFPNKDFWKITTYKLENRTLGESVRVDLSRGPLLSSPYTRFVTAIDVLFDSVYLTDGTRWDVLWTDASSLKHWMTNDVIIIGLNSGWFSGSHPAILINVTLNEYVAARRS